MATSGRDRIREAARAAAQRLAKSGVAEGTEREAAPGDLFVFGGEGELALEWLVVRFHPDDSTLLLLAPVDDFPLVGTPDLVLDAADFGRTLTVRVGETDWVPARCCVARLRVGTLSEHALGLVRGRLADLARCRMLASSDPSVDFDPEYESWLEAVRHARQSIVARAERLNSRSGEVIPLSRFHREPPSPLRSECEYALAAESGGPLLNELSEEVAGGEAPTYLEIPDVPGGTLVLIADDSGLRPVWHGPMNAAPQLAGQNVMGEEVRVEWISGPGGRLHRTSEGLPWIDGRVIFRVGTEPARTVVVEL